MVVIVSLFFWQTVFVAAFDLGLFVWLKEYLSAAGQAVNIPTKETRHFILENIE